jgi:putative endonuclease
VTRNRQKAEAGGRLAELAALWMLRLKGYRLLAHRFRTPMGEVDLIMRRGNTTAFIEVKRRPSADQAIFSVTPFQMQRIAAASRSWIMRDPKAASGLCRFDIVSVVPYQLPKHYPNAFQPRD